MFEYEINNDTVILYAIYDRSIKSIDIPRYIDGYPVTDTLPFIFGDCLSLEYINGVKLKEGVNVIDNRFLYINNGKRFSGTPIHFLAIDDRTLSKILFSIGDDYIYINCTIMRYLIDGLEYNDKFIPRFKN